jgi:hypothetical protein
METIKKIQEALDAVKADGEKFFGKDNNAAGTRTRTGAMDIIKLCKQLREEVQAKKEKK